MNRAFCILALAVLPQTLSAQELPIPAVVATPEILWDCLGSGKAAQVCVGAMTIVCQAENQLANDNLTERLCIIEETNTWRDLIARAEIGLSRALSEQTADPALGHPADVFRAATESWADYVSTHCAFERAADARSPMRAIVENSCQRDLSAARYEQLSQTMERIR